MTSACNAQEPTHCKERSALQLEHAGSEHNHLTVNIGVATSSHPQLEPAALLQCADLNLYQAKHLSRNQVFSAGPDVFM